MNTQVLLEELAQAQKLINYVMQQLQGEELPTEESPVVEETQPQVKPKLVAPVKANTSATKAKSSK